MRHAAEKLNADPTFYGPRTKKQQVVIQGWNDCLDTLYLTIGLFIDEKLNVDKNDDRSNKSCSNDYTFNDILIVVLIWSCDIWFKGTR